MSNRPFAARPGWQRVDQDTGGGGAGSPPPPPEPDVVPLLSALAKSALRQEELLEAILTELREQVPQGYVVSATVFVTLTTPPVTQEYNPKLFSLSLTNDGPGVVQYRIPNTAGADWIAIQPGEVIQVNFIKPKIASAAFRLTAAGTSTMRLVGIY